MSEVHTPREIEEMNPSQRAVYENLVRRMAKRRRMILRKSRRRDPGAFDYGTYTLVEELEDGMEHFIPGYVNLTLTEIHEILLKGRK
jgi:hypothetical protein